MYESTKLFSGYSTCFRQHKAESHCRFLHGYSLEFLVTFRCLTLDDRNWCMDFGGFKYVNQKLKTIFDHTTVISYDDPEKETFLQLVQKGMIDLFIMDEGVGCELFARFVFCNILNWVNLDAGRVSLHSVQCIENKTNTATYYGGQK